MVKLETIIKKRLGRVFLVVGAFTLGSQLYAQGCSDAGFCTVQTFRPRAEPVEGYRQEIRVGASLGIADHAIFVLGTQVEYNRRFGSYFSADARVTSLMQRGNGVTVFGLSDVFLQANYLAGRRVRFSLGAKLPLMGGNRERDGLPLPMDYQSSLGTVDILAGVGVELGRWQWAAALQQPIRQNENQFVSTVYGSGSPFGVFQTTRGYRRSGDVLIRLSYPFARRGKWLFTPSLLPLYHLSNDRYVNAFGEVEPIIGSSGLTVNANIYADYLLGARGRLQFSVAAPLLVRKARPDGLTRGLVAGVEYRYHF